MLCTMYSNNSTVVLVSFQGNQQLDLHGMNVRQTTEFGFVSFTDVSCST